ncbi:MAG: hypothetical protein MUC73_06165 [Cyclobacteriaceae bacterium]|nr:hypothetical protein [Cyclobacteriaceae bacterium]
MGKDWKYIAYLSAAILFYMLVKLLAPRELDWTVTLYHQDKNPFGTYALNRFMNNFFPGNTIEPGNFTTYELFDSIGEPVNFISISNAFSPGKEDVDALLTNVYQGGTAFISAHYFTGIFADTFSLYTSDYFFEDLAQNLNRKDTSVLEFPNPNIANHPPFLYPRENIHNYFKSTDSLATVLSTNDLNLPVTIKINHGQGSLFLNSTPLTFSNVYLLHRDNTGFAEITFSHLPNRKTYWTEYYQLGRLEARTPLRYILSTEPLRWAYYITIISLLLFILFEAKRKQRIIPILKPLTNTSLEFVKTVGNLYYQTRDHKSIADKRIAFFQEQLRTLHGVHTPPMQHVDVHSIARKTGNPITQVTELYNQIEKITHEKHITEEELKSLNRNIDSFKM